MSDYKSCLLTLDKVIGAFTSNSTQNELQSNQDIGIKKNRLFENMENHQQHLQNTLNSINSSHESYLLLLQNGSSDALNTKYDQLENKKYSLEKEIEDLQKQLKSQQENENNIDETGNQIDSIKNKKKQKLKQKIPALKHKLILYKGLFDIEWNEDLNQNHLSGFINNDQQIKGFKFNTNEISKFDLVNEMWKMCDSEIQNEINELQQLIN